MDKTERCFIVEQFQVRVADGDAGQDHHYGTSRHL